MPISALSDKLKIKAGSMILLLNAPPGLLEKLTELPAGCRIGTDPHTADGFACILLFCANMTELSAALPDLLSRVDENTALWISYPRKSSNLYADLSRDTLWENISHVDYRPVSQIAMDETWTAVRIRPASQVKEKAPARISCVDFEKRVVTPPGDLVAALQKKGLAAKFSRLSFTHQKEHVEAIVTAKKPETRNRRIAKTLDILNKTP